MCQYIKTSLNVTLNLDRERLKIIIKEVFLRHKRPLQEKTVTTLQYAIWRKTEHNFELVIF